MTEILFTPAGVVELLSQIDELKDVELGITQDDNDGRYCIFQIGDSKYEVDGKKATQLQITSEDLEEVNDLDDNCLHDLVEDEVIEDTDRVEGGIIKETFKTLLVGGLVRLTTKLLK